MNDLIAILEAIGKMLLMLSPVIASFIDNYITIMLENIQRAIITLA